MFPSPDPVIVKKIRAICPNVEIHWDMRRERFVLVDSSANYSEGFIMTIQTPHGLFKQPDEEEVKALERAAWLARHENAVDYDTKRQKVLAELKEYREAKAEEERVNILCERFKELHKAYMSGKLEESMPVAEISPPPSINSIKTETFARQNAKEELCSLLTK